jgi:SAM-dependent methyltransferase/spore coat polysaccharide biosynthesis predicted glycosyltransferase SpsG
MVPAWGKGRGGGHLVRSARLVRELRKDGHGAFLYMPESGEPVRAEEVIRAAGGADGSFVVSDPAYMPWDFIILDRFRTPPDEYRFWSGRAPLIGIDEGGPERERFDFLVDLLPGLPGRSPPNIEDPSLLFLPEKRRVSAGENTPERPRILVSFGAEDDAGLSALVCGALLPAADLFDISAVSLPSGESPGKKIPGAVRAIPPAPDLRERLHEYDLLITHFGLTAFEALAAGVSVLLVSPGAYHEKLARASGFFSAGKAPANRGLAGNYSIGSGILSLLCKKSGGKYSVNRAFFSELQRQCGETAARYRLSGRRSLPLLLGNFRPRAAKSCPLCGGDFSGKKPFTVRCEDRTYRRCPRCGVISMSRLTLPPIEYAKDYFFDFYKRQYGKTYLEDFPGLVEQGKRRLAIIKKLLPRAAQTAAAAQTTPAAPEAPALLDIGCAYGPFLAAAGDQGFSPFGLEGAAEAAAYVKKELGIPAYQGFFPPAPPPVHTMRFDAVTMWYVIEHFTNAGEALAETARILKPGGVFAFSTPSFSGISGKKSLKKFLQASPADHWTVWSPKTCVSCLGKYGFSVKKIVVTGHHPERFPFIGPCLNGKGPLYRLVLAAGRLFRLGDTFEVYAKKTGKTGG